MIGRLNGWWSDRSLRTKLFAVAGIPVLAVAAAAGVFAFSQQSERQAADQVTATIEVQRTIDQLLGELVDVEDGARGYLITGEPEWLEPYDRALGDIPGTLDHLQALLADNPSQEARAEALRPAVSDRLDLAAQLLEAAPITTSNRADALSTMTRGKATMDDLRAQLATMAADETRLLAQRHATLDAERNQSTLVVTGALAGAILGGGLAALLLSSGVVGRIRRLEENARQLSRGERLVGLLTGGDEIGRLAATLDKASALLADRERDLRDARAFLEQLIDAGPVVVLRARLPDSVTTYVSPNVERILGYTPEEIIGVPSWWLDHVAPEDRTRLNEQAAQAGADHAPQWTIDVRLPRRDGAEQWIAAVVHPDYDEQGARTGGTVYCWDITEQRRAQDALGRSERFLDSVIENLPDMVFVKDARELRFVRMNRAGEDLLGYPREALIGKNDYDFFPPEQATFFTAKDREVLQGGRVVDIPEEPIDTARQGQRILHTKKIPLHDAAGRPEYLLGISEDVTERKWAEAEVIAARTEAERANLAKSEFLSRMSHELRTPLNAILGFAQLLELDSLSSDQRESVTHIGRAGRHLLELINEVLDISRIETGQMTISPEPVAIADLLGELVALIGPLADGRSITIGATRAGCDVHVLADRQRLKQVLLNLLGNAVKYNREGGSVTVACAVVEGDRLRISVTDTGYGVRPDQLERLFQPFERLGAEGSEVEGTGMGLALSKGLVEAMGGRIGVESELDRGTTFWVELGLVEGPLETYENGRPDEEPSVAPSADRTHKVLHIEDNLSNLTLVERILGRRPDIELLSAMQGQLGIDLARQHRPDVILLDLHLPDTSGREVLRRLRTYPETRDTPVVIVSADATKTQIARLTADGATGYLTKPLDVKAFIELIDTVLGDLPPDGP